LSFSGAISRNLGKFLVQPDLAIGEYMVGNDHFVFARKRIDADQRHRRGVEAEFFPDLTRDAGSRRLVALEKTRDQAESTGSPGVVARQHDVLPVFDQRRQHRRRIVPMHETAVGMAMEPRQTTDRAHLQPGAAERTETPGAQADSAANSRMSASRRSTVSGAVSQPHMKRAPPADEVVEQPAARAQAGLDTAGQRTKTPLACTGNSAGRPVPSARPAASRRAMALACAACRNQAPFSRIPSQGADRKRIFDASWPACLQR
jgi:hypothetical protein